MNENLRIPIIRLEVEGIKYTMQRVLMEHAVAVDESIQKAIDEYCTENNINAVVMREAKHRLDMALKEEVQNFFGYSGVGRAAVRAAVIETLNERYFTDKPDKTDEPRAPF